MIKLKYPRLNLGVGAKKRTGEIGIDQGDFKSMYPKGEFIQGDIFKILPKIKTESIETIYSDQLLEHIPKDKFIPFMNQCYRILKVGGVFECTFPPAVTQDGMPNLEFYADPCHVNAMIPGTFSCFSKKFRESMFDKFRADYRGYGIETDFETMEVKFVLKTQLYINLIKDIKTILNKVTQEVKDGRVRYSING
jgi:predicted SAM-dependent methyltransferase